MEGRGIEISAYLAGWNTSRPVRHDLERHGGVAWEPEKENTVIYGVWDLPMIGNERFDIERRYQRMSGGPDVIPVCWEGTFVQRGDVCCQLLTHTFLQSDDAAPGKGVIHVHPAYALPLDSVLGVRPSALDEFSAQLDKVGGPGLAAWLEN